MGDGVFHCFVVCGAVYLKFGGGEKGRGSGNNGERLKPKEMSFKMNFTPIFWSVSVNGEWEPPGEWNLCTFIYGVSQLPRGVPFLANVLLLFLWFLGRYVHVHGVSYPLKTWRVLHSGSGYLCSSYQVGSWGPLSLRQCPPLLVEVVGGYPLLLARHFLFLILTKSNNIF